MQAVGQNHTISIWCNWQGKRWVQIIGGNYRSVSSRPPSNPFYLRTSLRPYLHQTFVLTCTSPYLHQIFFPSLPAPVHTCTKPSSLPYPHHPALFCWPANRPPACWWALDARTAGRDVKTHKWECACGAGLSSRGSDCQHVSRSGGRRDLTRHTDALAAERGINQHRRVCCTGVWVPHTHPLTHTDTYTHSHTQTHTHTDKLTHTLTLWQLNMMPMSTLTQTHTCASRSATCVLTASSCDLVSTTCSKKGHVKLCVRVCMSVFVCVFMSTCVWVCVSACV